MVLFIFSFRICFFPSYILFDFIVLICKIFHGAKSQNCIKPYPKKSLTSTARSNPSLHPPTHPPPHPPPFFFLAASWHMEFSGQGSDLSCSCNLQGQLGQCWILQPIVLGWGWNLRPGTAEMLPIHCATAGSPETFSCLSFLSFFLFFFFFEFLEW